MSERKPIIVDLDVHAMERLCERHPHFCYFDCDSAIQRLNENHSQAILYRKHHKDFAGYNLTALNLQGVFFLSRYFDSPNSYIAVTFKLLRLSPANKVEGNPIEVIASYSYKPDAKLEIDPQREKKIWDLAKSMGIKQNPADIGRTLYLLRKNLGKKNLDV
jgi:hypothetical protein